MEIEFHDFKKARFTIYEGNKEVYWSVSDTLSSNKERTLERYRALKTVKSIKSFIKKRKAIK